MDVKKTIADGRQQLPEMTAIQLDQSRLLAEASEFLRVSEATVEREYGHCFKRVSKRLKRTTYRQLIEARNAIRK